MNVLKMTLGAAGVLIALAPAAGRAQIERLSHARQEKEVAALAAQVSAQMRTCATIGIGAGADCHGQVLVLYDMLGVFPGKTARFVKNFLAGRDSVEAACAAYVEEVKNGTFPAAEHSY